MDNIEKLISNLPDTPRKSELEQLRHSYRTVDSEAIKVQCLNKMLHFATRMNIPELIDELLDNGAEIDSAIEMVRRSRFSFLKDYEPETPLEISCFLGHTFLVQKLIFRGCKINYLRRGKEWSALTYAARNGHVEICKLLLEHGADVDGVLGVEMTSPLEHAVLQNQFDVVNLLIKYGANVNKPGSADERGYTALMAATRHGLTGMMAYLLLKGANLFYKNRQGNTSLHLAAWEGHLDAVTCLVYAGADILAENDNGETPLSFACAKANLSVLKILHENMRARYSDREVLQVLNKVYSGGNSLIHLVCLNAHLTVESPKTIMYLIDAGVQKETLNHEHKTAYDVCVEHAYEKASNKAYKQIAGIFLTYAYFQNFEQQADSQAGEASVQNVTLPENFWDGFPVDDLLSIPGLGLVSKQQDFEIFRSRIVDLLQSACSLFEKIDDTFIECRPILVGSSACGIKIGFADEYDFFVKVKQHKDYTIENFVNSPTLPIVVKLKERFSRCLCKAMAIALQNHKTILPHDFPHTVEWNKVCTCFNLRFLSESGQWNDVSVDVTPCFEKLETPVNANEHWPRDVGYHYVLKVTNPQNPKENSSLVTTVPTFGVGECHFIKNLDDDHKSVGALIKLLVKPDLYGFKFRNPVCPDFIAYHNILVKAEINWHELYNAIKYRPHKVIDSYMLKMGFLHEVIVEPKADDWCGKNVKTRAISIFRYIAHCCRTQEMYHPLLNDMNILKDLKSKEMSGIPLLTLAEDSAQTIVDKLVEGTIPSQSGLMEPDFQKYKNTLTTQAVNKLIAKKNKVFI